jgi:cardiolipin synthase
MMLQGPAVLQLQQVFAQDWFFATDEELVAPELYPAEATAGDQIVQVIASGPDLQDEVCHELFFSAISGARRQVFIQSCYFVPPDAIKLALQSAAHRGVKVQIILPARSAHVTVLLAAQSYYEELLSSGVQFFEYVDGLMHSKVMTIDSEWSYVGSANLDNRSLRLNFEVGAVFYGPRMASQLEATFLNDLKRCRPVMLEQWSRRPMLRRLAENSCRLLSPVL